MPVTETVTFAELVKREPYLKDLLKSARSVKDDGKGAYFCANEHWYGYGKNPGLGFKGRLLEYVGWTRRRGRGRDELLESSAAYDVAYQTIYDALPNCRGRCGCYGAPEA